MASIMTKRAGFLGVAAFAGVAVGFTSGYFYAKKKLETTYASVADREIEDMRELFKKDAVYRRTHMEKPKLETLIDELGYASDDSDYTSKPTPHLDTGNSEIPFEAVVKSVPNIMTDPEFIEETKNIFADASIINGREWDYAEEIKSRDESRPYIIHKDEFNQGDLEYDKSTFTYYEGDDVLADGQDHVEDDPEGVAGVRNLEQFGHGSLDANVLYVRNDRLNLDLEILRSGGKYAVEVHGFAEEDLEHSATSRRRIRFDDD